MTPSMVSGTWGRSKVGPAAHAPDPGEGCPGLEPRQTNTAAITHVDQYDPNPANNTAMSAATPQ